MKPKYYIVLVALTTIFCSAYFTSSDDAELKITDRKATKATKALYKNLKELTGKGVLFGHQDDLAYGVRWSVEQGRSDVKESCGDYPAVYGWDIGWLGEAPHNLDSVEFKNMKKWMIEAYQRGGINTVSWHLKNPHNGESSWDKTHTIPHILPGGESHQAYLKKLDAFAAFAKDLKPGWFQKPIPIIFRPFHEHTGSWFWWGKGNCTAEEYKALWRFTVDYLRKEKDVHNILYCYASDIIQSKEHYLEFYPGDDYVDILGLDNYHHMKVKEDVEKSGQMLSMVSEIATEKDKIAALTETGLESVPNENWWTEILLPTLQYDKNTQKIAWVLIWRNDNPKHHYAPYKGHKSQSSFEKFHQHEFTLFERDLPNMYK